MGLNLKENTPFIELHLESNTIVVTKANTPFTGLYLESNTVGVTKTHLMKISASSFKRYCAYKELYANLT